MRNNGRYYTTRTRSNGGVDEVTSTTGGRNFGSIEGWQSPSAASGSGDNEGIVGHATSRTGGTARCNHDNKRKFDQREKTVPRMREKTTKSITPMAEPLPRSLTPLEVPRHLRVPTCPTCTTKEVEPENVAKDKPRNAAATTHRRKEDCVPRRTP